MTLHKDKLTVLPFWSSAWNLLKADIGHCDHLAWQCAAHPAPFAKPCNLIEARLGWPRFQNDNTAIDHLCRTRLRILAEPEPDWARCFRPMWACFTFSSKFAFWIFACKTSVYTRCDYVFAPTVTVFCTFHWLTWLPQLHFLLHLTIGHLPRCLMILLMTMLFLFEEQHTASSGDTLHDASSSKNVTWRNVL